MSEERYEQRTDSVEEKLHLLQTAHESGNHELAMSLAESIKDTLSFERQRTGVSRSTILNAEFHGQMQDLPEAWREWAQGWNHYALISLVETEGIARSREPVDLPLNLDTAKVSDPVREVRVAQIDEEQGMLIEIPSQIYDVTRHSKEWLCRLVFMADVPAQGHTQYVVFYGNPYAELPEYPSDLRVSGEGIGLSIENHHYVAHLSPQMAQLERLTYRRQHGLELYAGGVGHGEPPNIDWAHDYLASDGFQKFRVTNWAECPNVEVIKGPVCVKVKRWGFPHSPVHPLFTPSRMHITVTYTFYAGLPYFLKEGTMDIVKDMEIVYLRDDEWVFSGYSFTNTLWLDENAQLHEGAVPASHQDNLWGVGFFHDTSRDAFIALWLEHHAENFDALYHSGAPTLNYRGHGQLWSRWAARDNPRFRAGTSLRQRNAYCVEEYPQESGRENIERLVRQLRHPLSTSHGELPSLSKEQAQGRLARTGEVAESWSSELKQAIWDALREVRDEMFYTADANVVDMGYIYDVRIRGNVVHLLITMPHRGRPVYRFLANPIRERLLKIQGVDDVVVDLSWEPVWNVSRLTDEGQRAMGLEPSPDAD